MIEQNDKSPFTKMLENVIGEYLKENVYTQVPGHVVEFDPVTQLATVQIGLKAQLRTGEYQTPNPIIMCPVQFPGGKNGTLEFEINEGTEGWISFSHWAIDSWVQSGGVQVRADVRQFEASDATFFPGIRSIPGAITGFMNNGIRIRNAAGNGYFWVRNDGSVEIDGTQLTVRCGVEFSSTMTNAGVDVSRTHTHTGVESGPSNTGPVKS